MMLPELFLFVFTFSIGFVITSLLWPKNRFITTEFSIKSCFSVGVGLGIVSCNYFIYLIFFGQATKKIFYIEIIILFFLSIFLWLLPSHHIDIAKYEQNSELTKKQSSSNLLIISFITVLVFAFTYFIFQSLNYPHGAGDAVAIWNMRARFLFRAGDQYVIAFSGLYDWSHPDYPLLIPCNVSRLWSYLGHESMLPPILIAFSFTFATVWLVVSSLSYFKSRSQGLLAGLILLGITNFIKNGASQRADVPIGFYFLATIILFCFFHWENDRNLHYIFFAGLMAGFASWTKNEGLLFLISVILARFIIIFPTVRLQGYLREMTVFLFGALPVLLILFFFKTQLAPPNDIISGQGFMETITRLTDPQRYFIVGKSYIYEAYKLLKFYLFFIPIFIIFLGFSLKRQYKKGVHTGLFILCFQIVGYFITYIITPHDIRWHLKTSLNRLFIQLLPSAIFIFFIAITTIEELNYKKRGLLMNQLVKTEKHET